MLKTLRKISKAQSTVEYLIFITILLLAWFAVSNYYKRGLAGRWKGAVDDLGEQYDPRTATTEIKHTLLSNTQTFIHAIERADGTGFDTQRTDYTNMIETRRGSQEIGPY